jgi:hypothetical protein
VTSAGADYGVDDIVTANGVALRVTSIDGLGAVLSLAVVNPDEVYDTDLADEGVDATGGSGTGLKVTIRTVYAPGDVTVVGKLRYTPAMDPAAQQSFVKALVNSVLTSALKFQDTIQYYGTESEIEAVTPVTAGSLAIASDTHHYGTHDGDQWVWDTGYSPQNGFYYVVLNLLSYSPARAGSIIYSEESGTFGVKADALLMPDGTTLEVTADGAIGVKDGGITWEKLDSGVTAGVNNKVDKVTGKGLSTNDFNSDYKALMDFFMTSSTVTSLAGVPVTGQIVYANVNSNQMFSLASSLPPGQALQVFVKNTYTAAITVYVSSDGSYLDISSLVGGYTVPAGGRLEISVIYHAVDNINIVKVSEVLQ